MERAANKWIKNWIENNSNKTAEPGLLVKLAREAWEDLSPETKATLMNISEFETRSKANVLSHLLNALDAVNEPEYIKEPFRRAIKNQ